MAFWVLKSLALLTLQTPTDTHRLSFPATLTIRVNAVRIRVDQINGDTQVRLRQQVMLVLLLQRGGFVLDKPGKQPHRKSIMHLLRSINASHSALCTRSLGQPPSQRILGGSNAQALTLLTCSGRRGT